MFTLLWSLIGPAIVHAQGFDFIGQIPCVQDGYIVNGYKSPGSCTFYDATIAINHIINYGVAISGALALLMFVIGGWYLVASAGRKDWITRGKNILTNTIFGGFFVLGAWILVQGVLQAFQSQYKLDNGAPAVNVCANKNSDGQPCSIGICKGGSCVTRCNAQKATTDKNFDCRALQDCFPGATACNNYPGYCLKDIALCPNKDQYCCAPYPESN